MSPEEENYWREQAEAWRGSERAISVHLNGTCLGDIALVPAPFLKHPKGVRGVADWYMLSADEPEFLQRLFDRQAEIAVQNMEKLHRIAGWRTFKHSCGAVEPLIETFIDCGFDILNPVQCSADGMAPEGLKAKYGDRITFWGGGVNTQQTLPFGTPEQVREEVLSRCEIFAPGGGFVFNAIHNVQALSPIKNVVAMIDAVHSFNGNR